MRRLWRGLLSGITLLSLLLGLAVGGLGVRSYWWEDCSDWVPLRGQRAFYIASDFGQIRVGILQTQSPSELLIYTLGFGRPSSTKSVECVLRRWGGRYVLHWDSVRLPSGGTWTDFASPHWFIVLLFFILPALCGLLFLRRRRRHPPGCCVHCGYDLRATPDRCPECGWKRHGALVIR